MPTMKNIDRVLNIDLPPGQSAFLWGARKTGKSTYLKEKFPGSLVFDFLKSDLFIEFSKNPSLLREQLLAQSEAVLRHPVILDEVQKIPQILDEVHWLIENKGLQFILCGSSARKLKRGQANLLGGRAWRYEMFPLTIVETGRVDLLRALNHGLIPAHYLQNNYIRSLKAYVRDYLKEEVFNEGLTRNIPAFSRFFDAMGYSHGELTNYSNIARECGVDSKTVKEYYQILIDTLLGIMVEPFKRRKNRQTISKASKFYLFDVGVAGAITNREIHEEKGELFGKAFEHFILMQIAAHSSYSELGYEINFWRTKSGMEVDFILGKGEIAIEVKESSRVDNRDLKSLSAFIEEYSPRKAFVVCNEKAKRVHGQITVIPWRMFLDDLWEGKVIYSEKFTSFGS
jgi:predicted AAA+ superfamily ATPase